MLSELNLTIVSKCEQYSDHATRYLFRLNNIYYILKSLQRSNTLDLLTLTERDCERHYLELIQELNSAYQKSWVRLLMYISPLDELPRPINGKVKEKERAVLKERFSVCARCPSKPKKTHINGILYILLQGFNKELEEIYKTQRGISVPDVQLREGLKRDNAEHIIPQYNAFFEM